MRKNFEQYFDSLELDQKCSEAIADFNKRSQEDEPTASITEEYLKSYMRDYAFNNMFILDLVTQSEGIVTLKCINDRDISGEI